jgi:hypothetical protein
VPRIGVISDTHNYLDAQVAGLFAGVEAIIHAGDIGQPAILAELSAIAPVTAVLGNTDDPIYGWPETDLATFHGRRFLVHHIVDPLRLAPALSRRIAREQPKFVVFGHTHQPYKGWHDGVCFLNPGSATSGRFGKPRSVALIDLAPERFEVSFHDLGA